MYMCGEEYVHMSAIAHGGRKRASDSPELDLQVVVKLLDAAAESCNWVLCMNSMHS